MRFGDLGICQPLDDLHRRRRPRGPFERSPQEQTALFFRPVDDGLHLNRYRTGCRRSGGDDPES